MNKKIQKYLNEGKMDYDVLGADGVGYTIKGLGDEKKRPDREKVGSMLVDNIGDLIRVIAKNTSLKPKEIDDVIIKFKK